MSIDILAARQRASGIAVSRTGIFHAQMLLLERVCASRDPYVPVNESMDYLLDFGLVGKVIGTSGFLETEKGLEVLEAYRRLNAIPMGIDLIS